MVQLTPQQHTWSYILVNEWKQRETLFTSGNEGSGVGQMVVLEEGPKEQRLVMSQ